MKLSIGMIVKNESKYLRQCLIGLKPILDNIESELIIVDTGSTDDTVKIAREFTDRVFNHEWKDDFAEARNITIDKSQGEWYFYIDADEILENPEIIVEFFNTGLYKRYQSMSIQIKNLIYENIYDKGDIFNLIRLVKRYKGLKFHNKIHEQIVHKKPVYLSQASVIHYGYIYNDKKLIEKKAKRNSNILKTELEKDPNNVYLLYHLAKSYSSNENYIEALEEIEKAYDLVKGLKDNPMWIYNYMIEVCIKNNLFVKAGEVAKYILKKQSEETTATLSTYYYYAQTQAFLDKNAEAIDSYKQYLRLLSLYRNNKLEVDFSGSIKIFEDERHPYLQLGFLYDRILDFDNSLIYIKKIFALSDSMDKIESNNYFKDTLRHMIKICLKYKKYDELVTLYQDIINQELLSLDEIDEEKLLEIRNDIEYNFILMLEAMITNTITPRNKMIKRFADLDYENDYIFLNKLRDKKIKGEDLSKEDIEKVLQMNFVDRIEIYGELIFFLMEDSIDIADIMTNLYEKQINNYIEYMSDRFEDFSEIINNYFLKYSDGLDLNYCIFSKAFKRVLLIKEEVDRESYFQLFNRYVKEGIFYIEEIYRKDILDMDNTRVVKNNEEAFFIFMRKANMYKSKDEAIYVQYLRKALYSYDYMNIGIEMLLEEINAVDNQEDNSKDEFEEYKDMIKKNINDLIETKQLGEAKYLIDEYLKIVKDDLEMIVLKSEVELMIM